MGNRNQKKGYRILALLLSMVVMASSWNGRALAKTADAKDGEAVRGDQPKNPVHHCTKDTGDYGDTDVTDWSYIYFGSYPQTEMTGETLTAAITGASYNADGDAWVGGNKYRRFLVENSDYEHRYFKWEKIKWRVLQNDGNTLFVLADSGLASLSYHNQEGASVTWEDSSIRQWLNGDFYQTAFDSSEQNAIAEQTVINEDNLDYGTEGGNDTRDKVYLLSQSEAQNPMYGFCESSDIYSASRRINASDIAGWYEKRCSWWLRSPGDVEGYKGYIASSGSVEEWGKITSSENACVPALHINLKSNLWSMKDNGVAGGSSGGTPQLPAWSPIHRCTRDIDESGDTDVTDWSYIRFGSYPQAEVTGEALTDAITGASYNADGDALVDGIKYRRVLIYDMGDEYEYEYDDYRYFKWEKIKWRILQNNGNTLFVLADSGLARLPYHNQEEVSITWEDSSIRQWLNDDFYRMAFSSGEQNAIIEQTVINEDNPDPYYGTEGGNDTRDKVYLLSQQEAQNLKYGFCGSERICSASRRMKVSDFARTYIGEFGWWLRTPGRRAGNTMIVDDSGDIYERNYEGYGWTKVAPALHVDLNSDLWSIESGGGSGDSGGGSGDSGGGSGSGSGDSGGGSGSGDSGGGSGSGSGDSGSGSGDSGSGSGDSGGDSGSGSGSGDSGGDSGSGSSEPTKLTVSKPFDQEIKTGMGASFSVNVNGGNPSSLTCQWYDSASQTGEGTPIQGAGSFVYNISQADESCNGRYYYCVVSDGKNSVTSERAKLTVYWPPTVTEPQAVTVTEGESATFSVTASGGNPSVYTYQWYYCPSRDSETNIQVEGANSASYTIDKTDLSMSDRYYGCIVSNGIYDVRTEYAWRLHVEKKPAPKKKQNITVPSSLITLTYGGSKQINAKAGWGSYITYRSSDPKIVAVSGSVLKARKYGTVTITIKAGATYEYKAATKEIKVRVVPKKPSLTKASSSYAGQLSLKWKNDKTVTGFEVYYSETKNFKKHTQKGNFTSSKTSTTVGGFQSGKTYYIRMRSCKKIGKTDYYSDWSNVKTVKIK